MIKQKKIGNRSSWLGTFLALLLLCVVLAIVTPTTFLKADNLMIFLSRLQLTP